MATNRAGVHGAMFDTEPTNDLGGLCSGIGAGINVVYGPPRPSGYTEGVSPFVAHIGLDSTLLQACGFAGKGLRVKTASVPIPDGAPFSDLYVNRSGQTCPVDGTVIAVQP